MYMYRVHLTSLVNYYRTTKKYFDKIKKKLAFLNKNFFDIHLKCLKYYNLTTTKLTSRQKCKQLFF